MPKFLEVTDTAAAKVALKISSQNVVNILDYGAVGDGVTDCSGAIQMACEELVDGGMLHFPAGDYRFAEPLSQDQSEGAIQITGKSRVSIVFDPGARLIMDNLDNDGHGCGHGVLIKGACDQITLLNVTVEWDTKASVRSVGDGIRVMGYPSDSPPAAGWNGSTGLASNISLINCKVVKAAQAGAIFHGCSDVQISGFRAEDTWADGLHFNACRRVTVNNHTAIDCGDDGLAFVTYYDAEDVWQHPVRGPFNQPSLGEWNNSASAASNITVNGGLANGVRVMGGYEITVAGVAVTNKARSGVWIGSSLPSVSVADNTLAPQKVSVSNITVSDCGESGITFETVNIDGTDDASRWDFSGCQVFNAKISGCPNWSVGIDPPSSEDSKLSGITLRDIEAVAGTGGGGDGGILLSSLYSSTVDNVKLITDHNSQFNVVGASQTRTDAVESLPYNNIALNNLISVGGRVLVQDIAGLQVGTINSYNSASSGVVFNRVSQATVAAINCSNPNRSSGTARGLQLLKVFNVAIHGVQINTDSVVGTGWSAVELGGGDSGDLAGKGVRIERLTYVSTRNDSASDVLIQGGSYAPVDYTIAASWQHTGASPAAWLRAIYGTDTVIAPGTSAATSKTSPTDGDEIPLVDSAASNALKKMTWANIKSALKSYFDTLSTTLSNKTLDNTSVVTVKDSNLTLQDDADTSKQVKFQLSGISASTTRTLTIPNASTTLVGTDTSQTLTGKTLQSPSLRDGNGNTTLVLDAGSSSAVNYLQINNAGAGGGPSIFALGQDTSIPISFYPTNSRVFVDGSAVVTVSSADTLTQKTLTSPKVTSGNAPAAPNSSGTAGQIEWDNNGYLYLCISSGTWKRVQLSGGASSSSWT